MVKCNGYEFMIVSGIGGADRNADGNVWIIAKRFSAVSRKHELWFSVSNKSALRID